MQHMMPVKMLEIQVTVRPNKGGMNINNKMA